jgi:deoxyribodipyrimidine photo-lyase
MIAFRRTGTRWSPACLGKADGRRSGWWGLDTSREAIVDQLVTWRELGFNMSRNRPGHVRYEA